MVKVSDQFGLLLILDEQTARISMVEIQSLQINEKNIFLFLFFLFNIHLQCLAIQNDESISQHSDT